MTWKLSAFADEASESSDEQIAALKRANILYIDLRNVDGHNISQLPPALAEQIHKKLDAAGIRVAFFGSPIGKIDISDDLDSDLDRLNHLGRLAEVLDCRAVRIFSYFNQKNAPSDQWQQQALGQLGRLREKARELGLVLYHENERHIFGEHCPQVKLLADQLCDNESFKLIFDFDNCNQSGEDVWDCWQTLRDHVDAFHLKDSDQDGQHVPVGQGRGQIDEILRDARQRRWTGALSLEPHLKHSGAVARTGPSGRANQAFATMNAADCFQIAATATLNLLREIDAQ